MSLQTQQLESFAFESKKKNHPQTTAMFTLKYGDNLIALIFQQFSTAVY